MSLDPWDVEHENTDNNGGLDGQQGYYEGTDYALPYISPYSRIVDDPLTARLLRHMNCSYLGAPGHPPTLLALKQHAQSLACLISWLEPSISNGRVDDGFGRGNHDPDADPAADGGNNAAADAQRRLDNAGAFDWLASLDVPYHNDDPYHHKPLNALMNEVHSRSDLNGTQTWCPLTQVAPRKPLDATTPALNDAFAAAVAPVPFAAHANLVRHANECLERLDHEFSATGGLLSLIPPDGAGLGDAEFAAARNTLLGQLLLHMQAMYLRMHEVEFDLGNMRDALVKDAVAPTQSLTAGGPDGAGGRELVVNQDRYVIVNASDNTWRQIHAEFDKHEALLPEKEAIYRDAGLASDGKAQWFQDRGGDQYARKIIPLDVTTRIYRLTNTGHSTVFISPMFDGVDGTQGTRLNEAGRGVVSLVQPRWPERVSEWERRYREQIAAADKWQRDAFDAQRAKANADEQVDHLRREVQGREATVAALVTRVRTVLDEGTTEAQRAELATQLTDLRTLADRVGRNDSALNAQTAAATQAQNDLRTQAQDNKTKWDAAAVADAGHYNAILNSLGMAVNAMAAAGINNPDVGRPLQDAIDRASTMAAANDFSAQPPAASTTVPPGTGQPGGAGP